MERKLQISDLSVGDWVMVEGKAVKVESLGKIRDYVELEGDLALSHIKVVQPIPITPEILEKNGFNKNGEYNEWNIGTWETPYLLGVSLERPAITIKWIGSSIFIDQAKNVHQLQHAFRLAGIDIEIEL